MVPLHAEELLWKWRLESAIRRVAVASAGSLELCRMLQATLRWREMPFDVMSN